MLATTYHSRPSALIGVDDDWAAYQFDLAALHFAQHVEGRLSKKESLRAILGEPPKAAARRSSGFASVRQFGARRMKIPENGIW